MNVVPRSWLIIVKYEITWTIWLPECVQYVHCRLTAATYKTVHWEISEVDSVKIAYFVTYWREVGINGTRKFYSTHWNAQNYYIYLDKCVLVSFKSENLMKTHFWVWNDVKNQEFLSSLVYRNVIVRKDLLILQLRKWFLLYYNKIKLNFDMSVSCFV